MAQKHYTIRNAFRYSSIYGPHFPDGQTVLNTGGTAAHCQALGSSDTLLRVRLDYQANIHATFSAGYVDGWWQDIELMAGAYYDQASAIGLGTIPAASGNSTSVPGIPDRWLARSLAQKRAAGSNLGIPGEVILTETYLWSAKALVDVESRRTGNGSQHASVFASFGFVSPISAFVNSSTGTETYFAGGIAVLECVFGTPS